MSKPREFWIEANEISNNVHIACSKEIKLTDNQKPHILHVREVVEIDWEKIWEDAFYEGWVFNETCTRGIEQLVEKQLRGEK